MRLAIGTRGWYDDAALTHSRGIATAALAPVGHAIVAFVGIVVVVVVVGNVVVDVVDVVVGGTVVVVVVVVVEVVVVVVVEEGMVVVVVGGGVDAQMFGVVVVVAEDKGSFWADVVVADAKRTDVLSATDMRRLRESHEYLRRVTQ